MKIIFMGTPEFAIPSLAKIHENEKILCVVTQPDKPQGRGKKIGYSAVKKFAIEKGISVLQPLRMKEEWIFNALRNYNPDMIIVVAFGQILPPNVLQIPPFGCINLHASMLPKYRGAAPVNWTLVNGEKKTGLTTILMDEGMDTGDILMMEEVEILEEDNAGTLSERLAIKGAGLLLETIRGICNKTITPLPQDHSIASYAPRIKEEDCRINWEAPPVNIVNKIRGLTPYPGVFSFLDNLRVKILHAKILNDNDSSHQPGSIIDIKGIEDLVVSSGCGLVVIDKIQPENRRTMSGAEFLRGLRNRSLIKFD